MTQQNEGSELKHITVEEVLAEQGPATPGKVWFMRRMIVDGKGVALTILDVERNGKRTYSILTNVPSFGVLATEDSLDSIVVAYNDAIDDAKKVGREAFMDQYARQDDARLSHRVPQGLAIVR